MKKFAPYMLLLYLISAVSLADENAATPTLELGAKVFQQYCVLCHGKDGMGEGVLALSIEDYPNTNLLTNIKAKTRNEIHDAVVFGGSKERLSNLMPPMGNELTWTKIKSVVSFVELLRTDYKQAADLLAKTKEKEKANRDLGRQIFETRCALCHGKTGKGDGRMAKVIKTPPPANLVVSRLPDGYLKKIIEEGGEGVSRSPQMPPWGMQFEEFEIDSIILYVKHIRE